MVVLKRVLTGERDNERARTAPTEPATITA